MTSFIYFNSPPSPFYLESGIVQYQSGDSHPSRSELKLFDLIIVKSGALYLGEDLEEWVIGEGEGLVLLPDRHHFSVNPVHSKTVFYWVHFQTLNVWSQSKQDMMLLPIEPHQHCFNPKPYTIKLSQYFKLPSPDYVYSILDKMNETTELHEPKAYWQKQQAFETLLYVLDERARQQQSSQLVKLADQVELYLRNNYKKRVTNEHLSKQFNYHYNYISRAMKAVYQCSPHEYVLRLRMEEAKIQLVHSMTPIHVIAFDLGFEYAVYFTQCFKKYEGITPTSFRDHYRIKSN